MIDKKKIGKASRAAGARFELKVRKDLEERNFIVSKWMNNVEFGHKLIEQRSDGTKFIDKENGKIIIEGKLIPAKHKFRGLGRPMAIGTGFPDFVVWHEGLNEEVEKRLRMERHHCVGVMGVEVKSNGRLTKEEKERCAWLVENKKFIRIVIASKGTKRGQILYREFQKV